jgi:protein-tyrosine-phosphatase
VARVLFVCLHDAGRSQMSQALFERAATRGVGRRRLTEVRATRDDIARRVGGLLTQL